MRVRKNRELPRMHLLRTVVILAFALAWAPAAFAETGDQTSERISRVCNGASARSAACLKACRGLVATHGAENAFDMLPNVHRKNCQNA